MLCNLRCPGARPPHPHHRGQLRRVLRAGEEAGGQASQEGGAGQTGSCRVSFLGLILKIQDIWANFIAIYISIYKDRHPNGHGAFFSGSL